MEQLLRPVDVIALWGADGKLRPLRLRLCSETGPQRVDILQVVQEKQENRSGWEGAVKVISTVITVLVVVGRIVLWVM